MRYLIYVYYLTSLYLLAGMKVIVGTTLQRFTETSDSGSSVYFKMCARLWGPASREDELQED